MARAEQQRGDVMEHERDWEQEVVNADLWNRVQAAEAQLAKVPALVEALRTIQEDRVPTTYGGGLLACTQFARHALAAFEQEQKP